MRARSTSWIAMGASTAVALVASAGSCTRREPDESTYFARTIAPILQSSCARTSTGAGCHVADAKGNAFGNLDLSTYEGVDKRRDLLVEYGPYGQSALLAKSIPPFDIQIRSLDGEAVTLATDIKHAGGSIFDPGAGAFATLQRWIRNGATRNNGGVPPAAKHGETPCAKSVPSVAAFDPTKDPASSDFAIFRDRVNPVLLSGCAAGNCHGTLANELYLTCGSSPEEMRWNYFAAAEYLAGTPAESELLRRPLDPRQGGAFHEGGVVFAATADAGYRALLEWAEAHGPLHLGASDAGLAFFALKVQPVLAQKGCMLMHCHSASSFHDYRLRGGSAGSFSLAATRRNYELSLAQLSLESDDANASRLVRKNLYRAETFDGGAGIAHRGGPLLEDFGGRPATGALCDSANHDYDNARVGAIPAYCILREWLRRERAARALEPLRAIVYVARPLATGADRMQDFDVYAPGAELRIVRATLTSSGALELGEDTAVHAACGLSAATADIRRPAVSWDGRRIAFAARSSGDEPLRVFEMAADGSACAKVAAIDAGIRTSNGMLVHDFDPAYSPPDDEGRVRIVFASTRGNLDRAPYDYEGTQRTPADLTKPNANLYVLEPDPSHAGATRTRQLTFLLNMERAPSFMSDGRVVFTTEKRAPGFSQLALRRINLDGGDYHPLFGQRGSIGYREVTQVVQLADKNFAAIFADRGGPHRGGALGVINRSLGVDFTSRDPGDYPIDPGVIDPASPSSPAQEFFLHSLRLPDPSATGRTAGATSGVYMSPSALPSGDVLVSFGASVNGAFAGDFDVFVLNTSTGAKTRLFGEPGRAEVEAVPIFARAVRTIYASRAGEPNAYAVREGRAEADVILHDVPAIASLLFQNTPTGRPLEPGLPSLSIYESLPPTPDVTPTAARSPFMVTDAFGDVYVRRRLMGHVPVAADGSTHFLVPGGVPFVLRLPDTRESRADGRPRFQREEMMIGPGESVHEAMRPELFNGFCGQCHGAVSGRPADVAMRPDVLSGASSTMARTMSPYNLAIPPAARGAIEPYRE